VADPFVKNKRDANPIANCIITVSVLYSVVFCLVSAMVDATALPGCLSNYNRCTMLCGPRNGAAANEVT